MIVPGNTPYPYTCLISRINAPKFSETFGADAMHVWKTRSPVL
jgi:hypothetical protein